MEGCRIFKKILINIAHLPTMILVIGYPVYWLELYLFKSDYGRTTLLAPGLFVLIGLYVFAREGKNIASGLRELGRKFKGLSLISKFLLGAGGLGALLVLLCALHASLLPPHLIQESDALNYHITLPRQHLILGSFQHIRWATADLYLLPLDFALAPFWLCTGLPNKFPQFLFLIGMILVAARLVGRFGRNGPTGKLLIGLAIIGSHSVGIQMGTAMLDVVLCYLLLAALDSFLEGNIFLSAVEASFYFWSKSFIPAQTVFIMLGMGVLYLVFKGFGFQKTGWSSDKFFNREDRYKYKEGLKKWGIAFSLIGIFIGGPFLVKSLFYAGTPLYPFFVGRVNINKNIDKNSRSWQSLLENTEKVLAVRDQYGSDRSPIEFLRHLWLIAVPEKGVNNRYDYPVGLMYLLCVGPFIYTLVQSIRNKQFLILPLFVSVFWVSWWLGSHQSRFLYIPIIFMFIVVLSRSKFQTTILKFCVVLSAGLVLLSVGRAHRRDFGKSPVEVLRAKDQQLLGMSEAVDRSSPVKIDFFDAAFADFPVEVVNNNSVFVINH